MSSVYDFSAKTLAGKDVNLADYRGQVLLIVNTASKCGFTPQYEGLEKLYEELHPKGLTISAFPATSSARRSRAARTRSASSAR